MNERLRNLFWPILKPFEAGTPAANYRKSHRTILKVVGALFLILASGSVAVLLFTEELSALIPVIIFLAIGMVSLVVGILGSDTAVSRIWGNR